MRKLLLFVGVGSLVIGTAILLYDFYFFHRYGVDVNDVAAGVSGGGIADWPTGERPLYTFIPAWFYGVAFVLVAGAVLTVRAFLPRNRYPVERVNS